MKEWMQEWVSSPERTSSSNLRRSLQQLQGRQSQEQGMCAPQPPQVLPQIPTQATGAPSLSCLPAQKHTKMIAGHVHASFSISPKGAMWGSASSSLATAGPPLKTHTSDWHTLCIMSACTETYQNNSHSCTRQLFRKPSERYGAPPKAL